MGVNVPVYVKVLKTHTEVVRIYAVTTVDAIDEAKALPGVVAVLNASYDEPKDGEYEKRS